MAGTFTLTGRFKRNDGVTPYVDSTIRITSAPFPDITDNTVYSSSFSIVTDADGSFSITLVTEAQLYYRLSSDDNLFDPNPFTFAAPSAGATLDVTDLTVFDPSTITPTIAAAAAASAAAAAASAASVVREANSGIAGLDANGLPIRSVPLWRASTAFASGQAVQAPDGSLIKSNSARTSRASFDATEQTFWTVVSTLTGTLEQVALDSTNTTMRAPGGDSTTALNAFLALSTPLGVKKLIGSFTVSALIAIPANAYVDASAATITTSISATKAVTLAAGATLWGGTINSPSTWSGTNTGTAWVAAVVSIEGNGGTVERVTLNNVPTVGIGVNNVDDAIIRGCRITGNYPSGSWTGVETNHFGIAVEPGSGPGDGHIIAENNIKSCVQGVWIGPLDAGGDVARSITITGNSIWGCWNHGVYGYGSGFSVTGNVFHRCQTPVALNGDNHTVAGNALYTEVTTGTDQRDLTGISIRDAVRCTIVGNNIQGMAPTGSVIVDVRAGTGTDCSGNVIANNTVDVVGGTSMAIRVGAAATTCNKNVIHDNTVRTVGTANLGVICIAPNAGAAGYGNKVHDNDVTMIGNSHGIFCSNLDAVDIHDNSINLEFDSGSAITLGMVTVTGCTRSKVHDNVFRVSASWGTNITIRGINEGTSTTSGRYHDNDYYFDPTKLAGSATIVLAASSTTVINETAAGAPALGAGPGSQWHRTDGGASTSLYVKETAAGNTTWRAV